MIDQLETRTRSGLLFLLWLSLSCTFSAFGSDIKSVTTQQSSELRGLQLQADADLAHKHLECIDEYRDCLSLLPDDANDSDRIAILTKLAEALELNGQSQQEIVSDVVTNLRPKSDKDLVELWNLLNHCSEIDVRKLAAGCDYALLDQLISDIKRVPDSGNTSIDSGTDGSSQGAALKDRCLRLLRPQPIGDQDQTSGSKKTPVSAKTVIPSAWEVGPKEFDRILTEKIGLAFDSAKLTNEPLEGRILILNELADRALAACRFEVARLAIKDACRLFEDDQNPSMPLYLDLIHKSTIIELTEGKFDEARAHIEECQHLPGGVNSPETEGIGRVAASWEGRELFAKNGLQESYKYRNRENAMAPLEELTLVELADLYVKFERPYKAKEILIDICTRRLENNRAPNLRACGLLAWTFETIGNRSLAASTITQALDDAQSRDYFLADTEIAWVDYYAGMIAEKENNVVRARRYYHEAEKVLDKLSCSKGPLANRIKRQMVALK